MRTYNHPLELFIIAAMCTAILGSCSKNLSRISAHKPSVVLTDSANIRAAVIITHPVTLDTLTNPINNRIEINVGDSYYMGRINAKTAAFYRNSGFQTKWLHDLAPGPLYKTAIDILKNAPQYGLNPYDYDVAAIEQRVQNLYKGPASPDVIADLDIHISEMYFLFTTHLTEGRIRSVANGKNIWKRDVREGSGNDVVMLNKAENGDQLLAGLDAIQPANEQYLKLQQALAYYRSLDQQNQIHLQAISVKSAVKPGELNSAVPLIRRKLALTDLKPYPVHVDSLTGIMDSLRYDQVLVEGVKMFQRRHGLEPDGVIGEKTLKFMNQSFREKADIIALNMERIRWAPTSYGENYISVNVPEYKMRVFDQDKMALEMKVIVGASNKPTPIFSEQLEHIVFSPTWTVPVSIIREEIIPHLRDNPDYYASKNFIFYKNDVEIDPALENWNDENINPYQYRVVQNPGSDNSLGSVKFMMPNNLSVYLHDTPNHRLFTKDYRALSHGCVRLDEPAKFAEYLLRDQKGWTADRIVKAMNDSTPSTIHLKKRYQVHIEYRTAWVDENNMINFREDIYGHDKAQLRQLLPVANASTASAGM